MPRFVSLALSVLAGAVLAASCYSERPAPPSFRYTCGSNADCRSNETCIDGLCQVECTTASAAEVCTGGDHLLCFNGLCTSGCQVDNENCPASQECIDIQMLGLEISSGGGGLFGGSDGPTGLCGSYCDEDDPSTCPQGEQCVVGFCVATCADSSTCTMGTVCTAGLCVPETEETAALPVTSSGETAMSSESSAEEASSTAATGDTSSSGGGG